jgi:mannose-6-phosphate isomerase
MEIFKLVPTIKRPVWSGSKIQGWNKPFCDGKIGETWELSFLPAAPSVISGGEYDGKKLMEVVPKSAWGSACKNCDAFPLLVKFIDAATPLSVQVHPSDEYARKTGFGSGKTEAWYILEADEGAGIYLGFNRKVTPLEVEKAAVNGTITDMLNFVKVKKGECYFVKSGSVHAIGAGVTVAEVQQSSDLTYRVYDYGRLGVDGKPRELHLSSALDVLDYDKFVFASIGGEKGSLVGADDLKKLVGCNYFTIYEGNGFGEYFSSESFLCVVTVDGTGEINGEKMKKGDTFFVPVSNKITIKGDARYLITGVGI